MYAIRSYYALKLIKIKAFKTWNCRQKHKKWFKASQVDQDIRSRLPLQSLKNAELSSKMQHRYKTELKTPQVDQDTGLKNAELSSKTQNPCKTELKTSQVDQDKSLKNVELSSKTQN